MCLKFRSGADVGQWASFLLPLCLFPIAVKSDSFSDKCVFGIITSISVIHFAGRVLCPKHFLKVNNLFGFNAFISVPVSAVISYFTHKDFITVYLACLLTLMSFNCLTNKLLELCPGSFSLGEAQTVIQGICTFVLKAALSFVQSAQNASFSTYAEGIVLLQLLLMGLLFLVCSLYLIPALQKGVKVIFASVIYAVVMIGIWTVYFNKNLLKWFLEFCSKGNKRMYLLSFWFIMLLAAVLFVTWINQRPGYRATTLDRKYFHFVINAVFISGIICDVQFLCFASVIALGAFIVLEIYRLLHVPFVGPLIEQAFKIFLDEKDSGVLILTHIYLLIGCSSPVWLSGYYINQKRYHICLFSGIISVGFGDTFAAVGGTLLGKHQWKGSKKTLEGTACAVLVQLFCSSIFLYLGHPLSLHNISLILTSVILTSLLEALTTQVDNLVLPLFMFSILSWVR